MNQQGQLKASTSALVSASSTRSASVSWKESSTEVSCTQTALMIHPFSHSAFVDIRSTEDRAGEKHTTATATYRRQSVRAHGSRRSGSMTQRGGRGRKPRTRVLNLTHEAEKAN